MTDLIQLMSKLVTPQGEILIPGVEDLVAPLLESEKWVSVIFSCSRLFEWSPYDMLFE